MFECELTLFGDDCVVPGQPIGRAAKQASETEATRRELYNLDDLRVRVDEEGWGHSATAERYVKDAGLVGLRSSRLAKRAGKLCRQLGIGSEELSREPHERFKAGSLRYPLPVLARAARQLLAEAEACRLDKAA